MFTTSIIYSFDLGVLYIYGTKFLCIHVWLQILYGYMVLGCFVYAWLVKAWINKVMEWWISLKVVVLCVVSNSLFIIRIWTETLKKVIKKNDFTTDKFSAKWSIKFVKLHQLYFYFKATFKMLKNSLWIKFQSPQNKYLYSTYKPSNIISKP